MFHEYLNRSQIFLITLWIFAIIFCSDVLARLPCFSFKIASYNYCIIELPTRILSFMLCNKNRMLTKYLAVFWLSALCHYLYNILIYMVHFILALWPSYWLKPAGWGPIWGSEGPYEGQRANMRDSTKLEMYYCI